MIIKGDKVGDLWNSGTTILFLVLSQQRKQTNFNTNPFYLIAIRFKKIKVPFYELFKTDPKFCRPDIILFLVETNLLNTKNDYRFLLVNRSPRVSAAYNWI